jgi:hypothetical protein
MGETALILMFKSALEGLGSLQKMTRTVDIQAKTQELYQIIVAGQTSALEQTIQQQRMLQEISELKEKLRQVEGWETEKQRYDLIEFPMGSFAYILKKEAAHGEPIHYICANCYQKSKKSILHKSDGMLGVSFQCNECKNTFRHTDKSITF